ncbi:HAD family hydrolase [Paenibacillus montanisoli]|uniref:HAD family hydrolase n=1 Tax=Paenibacillus montanisoli TaxID=2081970 RepID=A0A328U0G9_9BACL|nr:HAD-IA family hydrolase [Paenibacillus montanisoli]RAP76140.1 HAD family hydrolase [Paenibacillus montanisoli]
MSIQAIYFDLFETLITEFENGRRRSKRSYDYNTLLGIPNEAFKAEWAARSVKRMNGHFASYREVILDILSGRELTVDEDAIQFLYEARLQEKVLPFEHVEHEIVTLLADLRRKGIRIGLISNCTEEEVSHWRDSRLADYFDDCIFSYEVKCSKPDTRIYALACERLQVRPEDCAFVGDGGSNELEGAARAGLRVFHAYWYNTYIQSEFMKLRSPRELMQHL